jgi:predicted PurR-regulated permease PerM
MDFIKNVFKKTGTKRLIIFIIIGVFLYLARSILNLFLLTFIFTYLMYRIQTFVVTQLHRIIKVQQRIVAVVLYLFIGVLVALGLYKIIPIIIEESRSVIDQAIQFFKYPPDNAIIQYLVSIMKKIDYTGYTDQGFAFFYNSVSYISTWGLNLLISLILSLFFLLEKNRIYRFTLKFKTSKISFVYDEIKHFSSKFLSSFGKVLEAQFLIALINGVLSTIALGILGFPQLIALGFMVFLLGLIPVAGVLISIVPLSIIAFSTGGITMVVYVLIMIAVLHSLEAYVLNPKLMSVKTELPVFYTFVVLILSEHFMGVWGFIIGIPIFIFLLDLLDVNMED